jgi:hypothetical protein
MGATMSSDFTAGASDDWKVTAGDITYNSQGAGFTVAKHGDAPTIQTKDYFFFGTVEVKMQAAPGTGIVSSIVLESDDLDEIDWVRCATNVFSGLHVANSSLGSPWW